MGVLRKELCIAGHIWHHRIGLEVVCMVSVFSFSINDIIEL